MRSRVGSVLADPRIQRAFHLLQSNAGEIEADQVALSLTAAPPFQEESRASQYAEALRAIGLHPRIDAIGNVLAFYERPDGDPVIVGAHLDTVFPAHIPLRLRRQGRILHLPGIADNGAGLAALLWILRASREAGVRFQRPVLAVANVGEEGRGNLRGIRHLFQTRPWGSGHCDFIAVDGAGIQRVTWQGLGSLRYSVRMSGPGGHSWADFGRPNPVNGLAEAIHRLAGFRRRPGTSFNVGVIHGGIGVNAIPRDAVMEVDLRSTSRDNLDQLHTHFKRCVSESALTVGLDFHMELMGDRPQGQTPIQSELVQAAMESTRAFGYEPQLDVGSTDANLPMSMGIPSIAVGAGGSAGNIHAPEEWFDPLNREAGLQRLLALVATVAGLAAGS